MVINESAVKIRIPREAKVPIKVLKAELSFTSKVMGELNRSIEINLLRAAFTYYFFDI
jgi:hypothetical protein